MSVKLKGEGYNFDKSLLKEIADRDLVIRFLRICVLVLVGFFKAFVMPETMDGCKMQDQ